MSEVLGTLEELPLDYRNALSDVGVAPLWPMMRNVLPHGRPQTVSRSHLWAFKDVHPLLLRAGELTPVEKAERRVLVLSDPGRGQGAMQATASLYAGLQLLMPGETAPAHVHTPSAARIIVEGDGGYTVVSSEKLPMHNGDLVLTPGGMWHDHGHEGDKPVIWLDILDLPIFYYLEGSYAKEGPLQAQRNRPDASQVEYQSSGLVPARRGRAIPKYPMQRFPWVRTEAALRSLAAYGGEGPVEVDYVNPETGESVMPVMGFSALMIRPGEAVRPPIRSSSAIFHVVKGNGRTTVDGESFDWTTKDVFSVPVFSTVEHVNKSDEPAFLIYAHDTPLQEKLNYYEERPR